MFLLNSRVAFAEDSTDAQQSLSGGLQITSPQIHTYNNSATFKLLAPNEK